MFAIFGTLLKHLIPAIENRVVHFSVIRGFICYFIFTLGILSVPSIGDTCTEGTQTVKKERIAKELFGGVKGLVVSDYNSYKCNFDGDPYKGSHAGWDADFTSNDNQAFYSLSPGIVIRAGGDSENTIAIYDPISRLAVLYLHADYVNKELKVGDCIEYGKFLGNQGNTSFQKVGAHVHVEVRKLPESISMRAPRKLVYDKEVTDNLQQPSHGTKDTDRPVIDPIPYLYDFVQANAPTRIGTGAEVLGTLKARQ